MFWRTIAVDKCGCTLVIIDAFIFDDGWQMNWLPGNISKSFESLSTSFEILQEYSPSLFPVASLKINSSPLLLSLNVSHQGSMENKLLSFSSWLPWPEYTEYKSIFANGSPSTSIETGGGSSSSVWTYRSFGAVKNFGAKI